MGLRRIQATRPAPSVIHPGTRDEHDLSGFDTTFAPIAKGVTNGDTHDHSGGDGAQVNHTTLSNIGTNTHATVDNFITVLKQSGIATCTSTLTLTTGWQDVPGCTVTLTPAVASYMYIFANADIGVGNTNTAIAAVILDAENPATLAQMIFSGEAAHRSTVAQTYKKTLTAAQHTIKMQATQVTAASGSVYILHTNFIYLLVPQ